jgi:hypothetical protein
MIVKGSKLSNARGAKNRIFEFHMSGMRIAIYNVGYGKDAGENAMTLPLIEKSNYYKGLLVLSRRDGVIKAEERNLLLKIGGILGFDKRFCEATIDNLLVNPHLSRNPIVFYDESLQESFFCDALRVALSDGNFHPAEYRWLRQTAQANGWTDRRLKSIIREFRRKGMGKDYSAPFEIQKLL